MVKINEGRGMKAKVLSMLVAVLCVVSVQASVVISDSFDRTGNLSGSSPDVGTGTWIVPTMADVPDTDGSVLNMSEDGGGTKRLNLDFDFVAGRIYTLTVDMNVEDGAGTGWLAAGFTTDTSLYTLTDSSVLSWMHIRSEETANSDGVAFGGYATGNATHYELDTWSNDASFKIVLDTSVAEWTTTYYVDDQLVKTFDWGETPAIEGVFVSGSDGVGGTVDNLLLVDDVIPEPATISLLLMSSSLLLGMRRLRI